MIVAALCLGAAALTGFLAFECALGIRRQASTASSGARPSFTVLMPAHDEAGGIAGSIRSVLPQLEAGDGLLVVADNCSDDTARIARSLGAEVIERSHVELKGKGYALEFGRAFLRGRTCDVIIILDADCIAEEGALAKIAGLAANQNAVVQGAYLLVPPAGASAKVRISCFAFLIKNLIRQRGLHRMAGAALLQGSGMAFPRRIFDRLEWRAASLVEDLDTGLDLLLAGERLAFRDDALFVSAASSERGTQSQRRRWEHGMLRSMACTIPSLIGQAVRGRWRLALVAFDLMVPPTVMLIAGTLILLLAGLALEGASLSVLTLLLALAGLGVALGAAWRAEGRDMLPLRSLAQIPGYILWKLPIAAQFLVRRERKWIRTERD